MTAAAMGQQLVPNRGLKSEILDYRETQHLKIRLHGDRNPAHMPRQ